MSNPLTSTQKLNVVLCWHMHQPQYQDQLTGEYVLPWTYLHAIKDYVDMAAHLEAHPHAKAVVNFAPILLEQIEDYAEQIATYLSAATPSEPAFAARLFARFHRSGRDGATPLRDTLLATLAGKALPTDLESRLALVTACLRANRERLVNRFEPFKKLAEMADLFMQNPRALVYVANQFLIDLVIWYHLAWLGETVRRGDARVQGLIAKSGQFNAADQATMLNVMGELIAGIVPRYRALHARGQVELAFSPFAHPIVPLLLDLNSALDAMPDAPMPYSPRYPGGEERARWHLLEGLRVFEKHFGFRPVGCWPSEGSVSVAALRLFGEYKLKWVATGSNVLRNSIAKSALAPAPHPHQPFQVDGGGPIACYFRDDGLSDLIGFTYSTWHADDAVANLIHHLESIAHAQPDPHKAVVSIILDGENAWEYFPENGFYFLSALYAKLSSHPRLNLTTFSECLDDGIVPGVLPKLMAGSWVYGTFSTWIGDKDKNRGWDMLVDAKRAFDRVTASGSLSGDKLAQAQRQLAICEGSDWFWWFGGYNPGDVVSDFERLYRRHLAGLYSTLGEPPPEYLSHSFTRGSGAPAAGGVMRPGSA